jgi:hypothetical protein
MLDTWATRKNFVYAYTFNTYTIPPNTQPLTIGSSGTANFSVTQRPTRIPRASVILNNVNPPVEVPLEPHDDQWWMDQTIKNLTSQQPTDFYYNPTYPDGQLYLWPVSTEAWGLRLECWQLLSQFAQITDPIGGPGSIGTVPPGYRNAMMLTLAETLLPGSARAAHPALIQNAGAARAAVFGLNTQVPRMSTADSGIPMGRNDEKQSNFNWRARSSF